MDGWLTGWMAGHVASGLGPTKKSPWQRPMEGRAGEIVIVSSTVRGGLGQALSMAMPHVQTEYPFWVYRAVLYMACRCMPGSWVVLTGVTWGRDSKGGRWVAGCRVQAQGAGCRVQKVRVQARGGQVQQVALQQVRVQGQTDCRLQTDRQTDRRTETGRCKDDLAKVPACDNIPSALVNHTCVWFGCLEG